MYGLISAGPRPNLPKFVGTPPNYSLPTMYDLAYGSSTVGPLQQATRTIPIVFPIIADPVAGSFVDTPARPSGSATGFMLFE